MKFACFGGAAAVADEEVAAARHRRAGAKFLFGSKGDKQSSSKTSTSTGTKTSKRITSPGRHREMTDFDIYMAAAAARKPSSSAPSTSSALSTAPSLDSACSSSTSSSLCSRSSSSSSLSSLADATPTQPATRRPQRQQGKRSLALGPAAVVVCLVMMVFGGRLVATLLTAAVLAFFPRQCPANMRTASSLEPAAASRREAYGSTRGRLRIG